MKPRTSAAPRPHPDISMVDTDNGTVVLDQRAGTYWQLNPTAALVLRRLIDGADEPAITASLAETYDVTEERARADVSALIGRFRSAGLILAGRR